jgi:hypothetical protein
MKTHEQLTNVRDSRNKDELRTVKYILAQLIVQNLALKDLLSTVIWNRAGN